MIRTSSIKHSHSSLTELAFLIRRFYSIGNHHNNLVRWMKRRVWKVTILCAKNKSSKTS
jgi:hypothetical protein